MGKPVPLHKADRSDDDPDLLEGWSVDHAPIQPGSRGHCATAGDTAKAALAFTRDQRRSKALSIPAPGAGASRKTDQRNHALSRCAGAASGCTALGYLRYGVTGLNWHDCKEYCTEFSYLPCLQLHWFLTKALIPARLSCGRNDWDFCCDRKRHDHHPDHPLAPPRGPPCAPCPANRACANAACAAPAAWGARPNWSSCWPRARR